MVIVYNRKDYNHLNLNETFFKVGQGYSFVSGFFLVGKEGKV